MIKVGLSIRLSSFSVIASWVFVAFLTVNCVSPIVNSSTGAEVPAPDHTAVLTILPPEENLGSAESYYQQGKLYARDGNWGKVVTTAGKAIELDPNLARAYFIRGCAYIIREQYEEAISDFSKGSMMVVSEQELTDLRLLANLAVPPGRVVILSAEYSCQQTGICNAEICNAPVGYNVTIRLKLFINPGESGITTDAINFNPGFDGKQQIEFRRFCNSIGMETLATNVSSTSPVSSLSTCRIVYRSGKEPFSRWSNDASFR